MIVDLQVSAKSLGS